MALYTGYFPVFKTTVLYTRVVLCSGKTGSICFSDSLQPQSDTMGRPFGILYGIVQLLAGL